jgi:Leucine-rich repeat (LRR) protein
MMMTANITRASSAHLVIHPNFFSLLLLLLQQVDLSRNLISSIEDFTLPVLADLNLSFNKLKSLPDTFGGMKSLVKLNLAGNALVELPPSIGHMPSLQVVRHSFQSVSQLV